MKDKTSKKTNFNRSFFIYFFSYAFVIIVPVVILSIASYRIGTDNLEKELTNSYTNSANLAASYLGERINQFKGLLISLGMDWDLRKIAHSGDESIVNDIILKFREVMAHNPDYIYSVKAYIPSKGLLVPYQGYLNSIAAIENEKYWIERVSKAPNEFVFSETQFISDYAADKQNALTIAIQYPWGYQRKTGYLALCVYEESIYQLLNQIKGDNESIIRLISSDGKVLSSADKNDFQDIEVSEDILSTIFNGDDYGYINKEDSIIFYSTRGLKNISVLINVSTKYITERTKIIRNNMFTILFILLIFGFLLSLWVSKMTFKPIIKIARIFVSENRTTNKNRDIFSFIDEQSKRVIQKSKELEKQLLSNMPVMREKFVHKLLVGGIPDRKALERTARQLSVDVNLPVYYVLIVRTDNYADLILETNNSIMDLSLYKLTIKTIVLKQFEKQFAVYFTEIDENNLVFLLGGDFQERDIKSVIDPVINKVTEKIEHMIDLQLTIAVSTGYNDIMDTGMIYIKTKTALNQHYPRRYNHVLYMDRIEETEDIFYTPSNEELTFIENYIRAGNFSKVSGFLNSFKENLNRNPNFTFESIVRFYDRILDIAVNVLNEKCGSSQSFFHENPNLFSELYNKSDFLELHVYANGILQEITGQINDLNNINIHIQHAIEFIHNNFKRCISLDEVAESLNINSSYLSRIFKDITGSTFTEYINKKRIEESKMLLADSRIKISDISQLVGYNTPQSFYKYFKKYTGITPNEYRQSCFN